MIAAQRSHPQVWRVLPAEPNTKWHMAIIGPRGSYLARRQRVAPTGARERKPASVAAAPPRGYLDLHDHIRALDKAGLLVTVDQPINKAAGIKAMKPPYACFGSEAEIRSLTW
jgi:hypothetical protein